MTIQFNTLHYVIAMLKTYEIKNIVASPGSQNGRFNSLVQEDDFFKCYSVIDERSAAYVAIGIINETEKPVVITCTGATASRNYLSAMTEAYYRKIPVVALTFYNPDINEFTRDPQYVNRTLSQVDTKTISVTLPIIKDEADVKTCKLLLHEALLRATYKQEPVHINCPSYMNSSNNIKELPSLYKPEYYTEVESSLANEIEKETAIFIGSHNKFSQKEQDAISKFAKTFDIPVFCDYSSNYKGENKVLISKAFYMKRLLKYRPKLVIDIGSVSGDYTYSTIFKQDIKVWRISQDGDFIFRHNGNVCKFFNMREYAFFSSLHPIETIKDGYYSQIKEQIESIVIPELPLCSALICKYLSKFLPKNSSLHLSILNSFRNMNFYDLDNSIDVNCNVGGFGIDGAVSTIVGQSFVDSNKKCFALIGDCAFFYDMNAIGNRDIKNNLRIILNNNGKGIEFRITPQWEGELKDKTDVLIASAGHNKRGAKGWAKSCGFKYMRADNKDEFINQIEDFCTKDYDKPVLFEVFTTTEDEQNGLNLMQSYNKNKIEEAAIKLYHIINKG